MGNRAYVVFEDRQGNRSPAVYLHWNGGPESIYAMLDALARYQTRAGTTAAAGDLQPCGAKQPYGFANDPFYAAARFTQLAGNFFGGFASLGLENTPERIEELAQVGDNGLYIVTPTGLKRCFHEYGADRADEYHWLTPRQVAAERRQAYAHSYHRPGPSTSSGGGETIAEQLDRLNAAHFRPGDELAQDGKRVAVIACDVSRADKEAA
jgi:hypothetical protein